MAGTLAPTEHDLQSLKEQITQAKQQADYEKLKKDLHDITYKAVNTPNEFEGAMQIPDTEKVLKTKRTAHTFFELLLHRIRGMFSVRPIIGNLIALLIAGIVLYAIFNDIQIPWFEHYRAYFAIGIQIFAAIQIIKSGTRSLLLPFLALVIGGVVSHQLVSHQTLFHLGKTTYNYLMVTGIIGLSIAILSID